MKAFFQHAAMTDGIVVRVAVNFLPEQSQPQVGKWFWVYHIRIENHSHETVQLITRWKGSTLSRQRTDRPRKCASRSFLSPPPPRPIDEAHLRLLVLRCSMA